MINRRHDGRASRLALQSLQQMLEIKPRIYLPATCKGGHESGPSPDKTFPERGEIDADQREWIVGSSWFLNRIRSATDAELSRVFHE
jgi:hypothetical protein